MSGTFREWEELPRLLVEADVVIVSTGAPSYVLTREMVQQFSAIVADETNLPLYVYDRDGALTAGLWFAHLRLSGTAEEQAIEEAKRLGLRSDFDADHRAMLEAARSVVAK